MNMENHCMAEEKSGPFSENLKRGGYCDSVSFVRITSFEGRIPCGELLNLSCREKFTFQGLDQMLLLMEDIMDAVRMPEPSWPCRCLNGETYVFKRMDEEKRIDDEIWTDIQNQSKILTFPHFQADFSIRCSHRQHGSMQGELTVTEKTGEGRKIYFRSALELIRLMYQCLEKNQKFTEPAHPKKPGCIPE